MMVFETKYDLDTVFFHVEFAEVEVLAIKNITVSTGEDKVLYFLKNLKSGREKTMTEKEIDHSLERKYMLRNSKDVLELLQGLAALTVERIESTKRQYLKEKLSRVLHGQDQEKGTEQEDPF